MDSKEIIEEKPIIEKTVEEKLIETDSLVKDNITKIEIMDSNIKSLDSNYLAVSMQIEELSRKVRVTAKEGSFNAPVQERTTKSRKDYNYAPSTDIELELAVSRNSNKTTRLTADATVGRGGVTDARSKDTVVRA